MSTSITEFYEIPDDSEVWVNITGLDVDQARKVEAAVAARYPAGVEWELDRQTNDGVWFSVLHLKEGSL
jgi:hypothetical protein